MTFFEDHQNLQADQDQIKKIQDLILVHAQNQVEKIEKSTLIEKNKNKKSN